MKTSVLESLKSKLPLPLGCVGIILIYIITMIFGMRTCSKKGDEIEMNKRKFLESQEKAYRSKFTYDIDSVAKVAIQITSEGEKSNYIRKGISFNKKGDKYFIRTEPLYQMPEEITAYNIKDLNLVIFQEYSTERIDNNTLSEREVLDIIAVDMKTKKIIYRNWHPAEKKSYMKRKKGVTSYHYHITREDVLEELNRIFQ